MVTETINDPNMDSLAASSSVRLLPNKGNEEEWIMDPRPVSSSTELLAQYKCRYGSSLRIITQGEALIGEEFSSSNPNKDWKKYQKQGRERFYCIIEDMSSDEVVCAARAIIDFPDPEICRRTEKTQINKTNDTRKCDRKRVILDYIHTVENCRGQGLAAEVVRFLQRLAAGEDTDFYVLAIEESQGYFLSKFDMILEQDQNLRDEYNCFSDTFLLKCPNNVTGSKDTKLHPSFISTQDDEEEDDDVDDVISQDEELILQQALQASLQTIQYDSCDDNVNSATQYFEPTEYDELTYEQQLQQAMHLSLNGEVNSSDEQKMLEEAITLSLQSAKNDDKDEFKKLAY